jgi:Zn-dependent peptidase ImmA (M78 family)|tara:strand:- start:148 stop:390 length:243 start_codon:yes stop_codon:yes gene_type:complete
MDNNVTVDMRTYGDDRGTYYAETHRCVVNLNHHESLDDVYQTIQHELLHFCFDDLGETPIMDEDQEERLIFRIQWSKESF